MYSNKKLYQSYSVLIICTPYLLNSALTNEELHREQIACQKIKDLINLPYKTKERSLNWTTFIDDLLTLLTGIEKYEALYQDLKLLRAPRGFRIVKLMLIAKKLSKHQKLLQKMCDRAKPLSLKEGRKISLYITF